MGAPRGGNPQRGRYVGGHQFGDLRSVGARDQVARQLAAGDRGVGTVVPATADRDELRGRPFAAYALPGMEALRVREQRVVFGQAPERDARSVDAGCLQIVPFQREQQLGPALLVAEVPVAAPPPVEIGEGVTRGADLLHAVAHQRDHQAPAAIARMRRDAADAGHAQRRGAHVPGHREDAHRRHQPAVAADRVVAAHVLVGRPVELGQQRREVVRAVRVAEGVVEQIHRLLEVRRRELDDPLAHRELSVSVFMPCSTPEQDRSGCCRPTCDTHANLRGDFIRSNHRRGDRGSAGGVRTLFGISRRRRGAG